MRQKLTRRQVSAVKRETAEHPLLTSKQLFQKAGVSEVPRTSRCRLLQTVAKSVKPNIHPPLTSRHNTKRVEWARHYMKVYFQTVLFTYEWQATLLTCINAWLQICKERENTKNIQKSIKN